MSSKFTTKKISPKRENKSPQKVTKSPKRENKSPQKVTKSGLKRGEIPDLFNPVYFSFFLSFLALTGTTLITGLTVFSRGVQGNTSSEGNNYAQMALISETCVNVIAGATYYSFLKYLYEDRIKLENVTSVRYIDWFLTTPFLLISFALYCNWRYSSQIDLIPLAYIIPLNLGMLVMGYLGETGRVSKGFGFILGFGFFAATMYYLYDKYVDVEGKSGKERDNLEIIFWVFLSIWALYGMAYLLPVTSKNISYNILDVISKAGFGLFLWLAIIEDVKNDGTLEGFTSW